MKFNYIINNRQSIKLLIMFIWFSHHNKQGDSRWWYIRKNLNTFFTKIWNLGSIKAYFNCFFSKIKLWSKILELTIISSKCNWNIHGNPHLAFHRSRKGGIGPGGIRSPTFTFASTENSPEFPSVLTELLL